MNLTNKNFNKNKFFLFIVIVFVLSAFVYSLRKKNNVIHKTISKMDVNKVFKQRGIFLPSKEELGITNQIAHKSENSKFLDDETLLVDDLPFNKYWQLEDKEAYVFHPMAAGLDIRNIILQKNPEIDPKIIIERFLKAGITLPNGGLAWYYPDVYTVNRMSGPGVAYSGISQAEILSGLMTAHQHHYIDQAILDKVLLSFYFDVDHGGISFDDKAILEFPLYFSPPETILNGWLHALLRLTDYWIYSKDEKVKQLLDKNIEFLAKILPLFDDPEHKLSRYSDLTPFKGRILGKNIKSLQLKYQARKDLMDRTYEFDLTKMPVGFSKSSYDNQIIQNKKNEFLIYFGCSQLFSTKIIADAEFSLKMKSGEYSPDKTMPTAQGELLDIHSKKIGDRDYEVDVDELKDKLICGYPTNFIKMGLKNYYHMQHVVSLGYLIKIFPMKKQEQDVLANYFKKWLGYTNQHPGLHFYDKQEVLETVNRGKFYTQVKSFSEFQSKLSK